MRITILWLAALILAAAYTPLAAADNPYFPGPPRAPDACGPGSYCTNPYGMMYGPNYNVRPPFPPFVLCPPPPCGACPPNFPMHPFARGPRDFFMLESPRDFFLSY